VNYGENVVFYNQVTNICLAICPISLHSGTLLAPPFVPQSMAYIEKRGEKWRAQIRRAGQKSISRTFTTQREALAWSRSIEHQADTGKKIGGGKATIKSLLQHYREARAESGRPIGRQTNEHYMLNTLEAYFGATQLQKLSTTDIKDFCRSRRRQGAGPYTVNMELSKFGTALRYSCSLLDIPYMDPVATARPALRHFGLIGAQNKRERRPTPEEWLRLMEHFATLPTAIPMADIVTVAALSAFRRGELVKLRWSDLDVESRTIMVRDRKHPRQKKGNNEVIPLVGASLDIIMRQPRTGDLVFPYNVYTLSYWFTRSCKELGIVDLHFHDMRHEATSALFEAGLDIAEVATVTGHKSWTNLKRYTNLRPEDVAKKTR